MSMEYAFLRALETTQSAPLGPRVRKALRHSRRPRTEAECPQPKVCGPSADQAMLYRWRKLGQRWASLRLGGCAWVGPIDAMRDEWGDLVTRVRGQDPERFGPPLEALGDGLGLSDRCLDGRSRDYLLRAAATRAEYAGGQSRLPGVRWFSPATLVVEAVLDLSVATGQDYAALRARLEPNGGDGESDGDCSEAFIEDVRCALGQWLAQYS